MQVTRGCVTLVVLIAVSAGCLWNSPRQGMHRSELPEPQVVQKIPCSSGYIWKYKDGTLGSCRLSEDSSLGDAELPAGTTVFFKESGELDYCFLPQLTQIQGYPCKGNGMAGAMTGLFPSGKLRYFWPPEPVEVGELSCKGCVSLHENGTLRVCKLAGEATVNGNTYVEGQILYFDENGDFVRVKE